MALLCVQVPTSVPFTSPPSKHGTTIHPTARPTSQPTSDLSNVNYTDVYMNFVAQRKKYLYLSSSSSGADKSNAVMYSTYFYKTRSFQGGCGTWKQFVDNQLMVPLPQVYFSQIDFSSSYRSLRSARMLSVQATCKDASLIAGIVNGLTQGLSFSGSCGGHVWKVFPCASSAVLCVDCDSGCTSCPGNSFLISPCRTPCTVHAASFAIAVFSTGIKKLYPLYRSPMALLSSSKYSVSVALNLTKPGTELHCTALCRTALYTLLHCTVVYCSAL